MWSIGFYFVLFLSEFICFYGVFVLLYIIDNEVDKDLVRRELSKRIWNSDWSGLIARLKQQYQAYLDKLAQMSSADSSQPQQNNNCTRCIITWDLEHCYEHNQCPRPARR